MDTGELARRFPLVARPRPACPSLHERVRALHELAAEVAAGMLNEEHLGAAASVLNRAALIASDCGLSALAKELCWRHADTFLVARPLPAREARFALEPIVNLGRLLLRDGEASHAYRLLENLHHAVRTRTSVVIDERRLSLRNLTHTAEDHRAVCQWLWGVFLAEGSRALTSAGRWNEALRHAEDHQGIGRRLLDGRQVAILAQAVDGDADEALAMLVTSRPDEVWETGVASCLEVLCRGQAGRGTRRSAAQAARRYLEQPPDPSLVVFRTRLGLACYDLTVGIAPECATQVARRVASNALVAGDGYVAREVLQHPGIRARLRPSETATLVRMVRDTGLSAGAMPAELRSILLAAVQGCVAYEARCLKALPAASV